MIYNYFMIRFGFLTSVAIGILLIVYMRSCRQEIVPERYRPRNEHETYKQSLRQANILESALGQEWLKSSRQSLENPFTVNPPHKEAFFLDPAKAESMGYRFSVKRGQKIEVKVVMLQTDSMKIFIDLYRVNNDSLKYYQHVASADSSHYQLAFEPRKDADYILRLQPELLRGGRFNITIQKVPSYSFPVAGRSSKSIWSYFGAPRDDGKRDHHGVDIFAKRHTPIIAPVRAYVRSVTTRSMGGNIIWLRDSRGHNLYFAHLQTQLVNPRTYVNAGDTIGTVGNTGNAKSTPTHLHFGIYRGGPIDPINFIRETNTIMPNITAGLEVLGYWVRTKENTYLKENDLAVHIDTLEEYQPMKVIGVVQSSYRVALPNGLIGYINESEIEPTTEPILKQFAAEPYSLLVSPSQNSITKAKLTTGEALSILAMHERYWLVRTSIGQFGWVQVL